MVQDCLLAPGLDLRSMSSETFLLEAGLARAGCLGLCLGGFWASPRTETRELLSAVPVFEGRLLATFATGAHCCLTLSLVSMRTPHIFSCKVYQQVRPSLLWSMGFFIPNCRTLYFPLLNVAMFLWAHFSGMLKSLWTAAELSAASSTSTICQLAEGVLCPIIQFSS